MEKMSTAIKSTLDPSKKSMAAERFEEQLFERIVGQDQAVEKLARLYQIYLAGLYPPQRPIGNFLFLGPTGSGKTRTVEAACEILFGTANAVLKIDCAEYAHSHEISRLIGSPPGYLGHRETTPYLSQSNLERYRTPELDLTFVLFDEIEKASDTLWSLLLGILDKGRLTLGDNTEVDMTKTIIIMTGNIGAQGIEKLLDGGIGFAGSKIDVADDKFGQQVNATVIEAARRKFSPEFMNRIDSTVVFKNLTECHIRKILEIELTALQRRIMQSSGETKFSFEISNNAKEFLLHEGVDLKYGARHLKRAIERFLVYPMSNLISTGQIHYGDHLCIDFLDKDKGLEFLKEAPKLKVIGEALPL
ncbi:MAG: AAA domain-containing protein [bacterium]|nr:AAA domain-containing protein [bacterium]